MPQPVRYTLRPAQPEAQLFEVTCTVPAPDPEGQVFAMAAWTPGSYLIREFARNVVAIAARCGETPAALEKIDKQRWRAAPCAGPLTLTCTVHAAERSVRTSHLDATHGFVDGAGVFVRAAGHEDAPCVLDILPPAGEAFRGWRVATGMAARALQPSGFGTYEAADFEELIDHPVEMGRFERAAFDACGVPHEVVLTGGHRADTERLCRDLKTLCEHHLRFFGGAPPITRYLFLVTATGEEGGRGGLEHRASSALMCDRNALPAAGEPAESERYRRFLRLASHEYFHLWNVKRIVPQPFRHSDLARESYTRQLWAFEGMTSYYADLSLVRCGLVPPAAFLELLGEALTAVMRTSGHRRQTLEEASFDAWIKAYRRDANAPNALVSYYAKGELVALALDLLMRSRTRGERSLDDVMRALWRRHGEPGVPVPEGGVEAVAAEVSGLGLKRFFDLALRSTRELPLARLLAAAGIAARARPAESQDDRGGRPVPRRADAANRVTLGARFSGTGNDVVIAQVYDGGPARKAGLVPGDVLVALDGLRVTPQGLPPLLARLRPGDNVTAHYFRNGELRTAALALEAPPADTWVLSLKADAGERALALRRAWLHG